MDAHPSPALADANRRLYELRAKLTTTLTSDTVAERSPAFGAAVTAASVPQSTLPAHLGWGSAAVTAVLRAHQPRECTVSTSTVASVPVPASALPEPMVAGETAVSLPETVRLYPDIALAMLRRNVVASGRLWLLLRTLDQVGKGSLRIVVIQNLFTNKDSSLYLCGRRQLRNLLKQGEGPFWQRDGERMWLRGMAKVAARLGVARLSSRPVNLPVSVLLGGVGDVKAHFYASFHSGRRQAPISRETLTEVTGVSARTQLRYEGQVGVSKRHNLAVGERLTAARLEERAWARGTAVFTFTDYLGRQGPARQQYIAWHLPNSYSGPHAPARRGRMRKINRELTDLVNTQARGNGGERLFYADGGSAARVRGQQSEVDVYWPQQQSDSCGLWWCV